MRKVLISLLCIAGVAAFTACGPKGGKKAKAEDGEVNLEKVAENIMQETFNGEKNTPEAADFAVIVKAASK